MEVCSNGPDHMTKIVAMPIYGKKPFEILIQNQKALVCSNWDVGPTKFVLMMILVTYDVMVKFAS